MGGNAPLIVFDDADLDKAVQGAIFAKFRNAGQTCVCANRIYVHDNIYQAFAEKFVQEVQKFKVGNGLEDGVQIGPLINEKAVLKAQQLIDDAVSKGAKIACGGKQHALGQTFYEPSVLTNVDRTMEIVQEEILVQLRRSFALQMKQMWLLKQMTLSLVWLRMFIAKIFHVYGECQNSLNMEWSV